MLNTKSIERVNASRYIDGFRMPLETDDFASIPNMIPEILTGNLDKGQFSRLIGELAQRHSRVVALFVDAFGWNTYKSLEHHPLCEEVRLNGVISKLTSMFPSATPGHVTTIHSQDSIGVHGVIEWNMYDPVTGIVIEPLPFRKKSDKGEKLSDLGHDPNKIFPTETVYNRLARLGIRSHVFQPDEIANSQSSQVLTNGAEIHPYKSLQGGLKQLAEVLKNGQNGYYFFYYGKLDAVSHEHGPNSDKAISQAQRILTSIQTHLLNRNFPDTLLLMFADHGQITTPPERCVYINEQVPELLPLLQDNPSGENITATGGRRDLFLHIKPAHFAEAASLVENSLGNRALVKQTDELINEGLFGRVVSTTFRERIGNLAILPNDDYTVWWFGNGDGRMTENGSHGGLSPEEMDIPLFAYSFR